MLVSAGCWERPQEVVEDGEPVADGFCGAVGGALSESSGHRGDATGDCRASSSAPGLVCLLYIYVEHL